MASPQNPTKDNRPAQVSLINGSFEQPELREGMERRPDATFNDEQRVPGWIAEPTDPAQKAQHMIELWRSGFEGVSAAPGTGSQFAELNAEQASTLYQDVDTPTAGATLYWSLMHRGRGGRDTMAVDIGPPGGPLVEQAVFTDDEKDWYPHQGTYVVPAGQPKTRFAFRSVSHGDSTVGNLLDHIVFGTPPHVVLEKIAVPGGESQIGDTITYQVNATNYGGVPAEELVLTDAIPEGAGYVPGSMRIVKGPGAGTALGDFNADLPGRTLRFYLGSGADPDNRKGGRLDPAGNGGEAADGVTVEFQVQVESPGAGRTIENQATATFTNTRGERPEQMTATSNATSTSVTAAVELELINAADRTELTVGEVITFTLKVTNKGPSPATGIQVTDVIMGPQKSKRLSVTISAGVYDPQTPSWTIDNLAVGESATLHLKAQVTQAGAFTKIASARANETIGKAPAATLSFCVRPLSCALEGDGGGGDGGNQPGDGTQPGGGSGGSNPGGGGGEPPGGGDGNPGGGGGNPDGGSTSKDGDPVDLDALLTGEKMLINMHNGGWMSVKHESTGRERLQSWRAGSVASLKDSHRWEIVRAADGGVKLRNVRADRYVEPKRQSENSGSYGTIGPGTEVWVEKGTPAGARQSWELRRYGRLYMIVLAGTEYALGLSDPTSEYSFVRLYDAHYTSRNLWWIADAQPG